MSKAPPPPPPPPKPVISAYPGLNNGGSSSIQQELESRVRKSEDVDVDCATSLYGYSMPGISSAFQCKLCNSKVTNPKAHSNSHSTQVLPWLFIGSMSNSQDISELTHCEIQAIINCTSECSNSFLSIYHYFVFPMSDGIDNTEIIKEAAHLLENFRIDKVKVFVYCVQGVSRAPGVVIYYLMRFHGMILREAYEFIKSKRSIVKPRRKIFQQLLLLELEIFGINSMDITEVWEPEDNIV